MGQVQSLPLGLQALLAMRPWAPRSQSSFPIFTALCPPPSPSPGCHDFFGMVSSPTAPPLALLSTSHPPMITGSTVWTLKGQGPSPACSLSESKGPHSAPWLFPEPLRHPTQGWGLGREEPGTPGPTPSQVGPRSHTREKAHSRQYPPGHQLLSIVTAGGGGKAQESRGKSEVVKGKTREIVRRNCR